MSDNNLLLAVLAIGGLFLFIGSSDDQKTKTLQKQQAAGGNEQAVADNPTKQQQHNRNSAMIDIREAIRRYQAIKKWESEHQAKLQKDLQFPGDVWMEIKKLRSALNGIGAAAQKTFPRNVDNPQNRIFWGDFDKLIVGTNELNKTEIALRSARPAPTNPPEPATHVADKVKTNKMDIDTFTNPTGFQPLSAEAIKELARMTFNTLFDEREKVKQAVGNTQALGEQGPTTTTNPEDNDFNMGGEPSRAEGEADRLNNDGFSGTQPSTGSAPKKVDRIDLTGEDEPMSADEPRDSGNNHPDIEDNKRPAPDPPQGKPAKKRKPPPIPDEDVASSFDQSGKYKKETAKPPPQPGQAPGDGQLSAQITIEYEAYKQQLLEHAQKLRKYMEDKGRRAESVKLVKEAWQFLLRKVPDGLEKNNALFADASFQENKKGYQPEALDAVRKNKFYQEWNRVVLGVKQEYDEFINIRKAAEMEKDNPPAKRPRTRSQSAAQAGIKEGL